MTEAALANVAPLGISKFMLLFWSLVCKIIEIYK